MLNEDVHLKLIKLYTKTNKTSRAVRHLLKLEYFCGSSGCVSGSEYFSSSNWHKNIIDTIEATLNCGGKSQVDDDPDKPLLRATLAFFLVRHVKSILLRSSLSELSSTSSFDLSIFEALVKLVTVFYFYLFFFYLFYFILLILN